MWYAASCGCDGSLKWAVGYDVSAVWSVAWLMAPAVAAAQTAPDEAALDWLAIPLMKFNDDAGFVYGVKLEMVKAAAKGSLEPHDWNLTMKLLHSTTNRHEHRVEYDLPGAFGSPWRLVVRLDVLHIDDAANGLFGTGHAATAFDDVDVFERGPQISPLVD